MKTAMSEGPQIAPYEFKGTSEPVGPEAVDDIDIWRCLGPEILTRQKKHGYEEQSKFAGDR